VAYKLISGNKKPSTTKQISFPGTATILLTALLVAAVSFAVRLWMPLGSELGNTGLQLPYFPQYIAMMFIGILFAKYNWFNKITFEQGIRWFVFAQVFTLVIFPLLFFFGTKSSGLDPFMGGWTWQAASLSAWEQLTGFSIMIGLVGIFKLKFNTQRKLGRQLSGAAYAVFITHSLVIVTLSGVLKDWEVYPVLKFIMLAPVALFLCFGIGLLLKMMPLIKKVI